VRPLLPERDTRSKRRVGRLGDLSRKKVWASLCSSRLGETGPLGRDSQVSPLFSCNSSSLQPKQHIHTTVSSVQNQNSNTPTTLTRNNNQTMKETGHMSKVLASLPRK